MNLLAFKSTVNGGKLLRTRYNPPKIGQAPRDILLPRAIIFGVSHLGLRKNRSLTSLYDSWYDPPWDYLYENIGSNHKSYQIPEDEKFIL